MFDLLKNKKKINKTNDDVFSKIASLLIHAAKIDENYSEDEKIIIKKTLIELGVDKKNIEEVMNNAEVNEANSNQILEFTKEVKNLDEENKIKIVETLWSIIYSDNKSDIYESNLMRRLSGLLYLDNKVVGDIKSKIIKNKNDISS
tara:strand:+ start:6306 stop:6743 length:438 start_codon:yes stop_codon:yes gene_type:complete